MSENNLCTDEYNLGKPHLETQVYGTFGKHSIKKICRYCLQMQGYGVHGAATAKPAALQTGGWAQAEAQDEFVSPNIAEHKARIEQLLANNAGSPSDQKFLDSLLNGTAKPDGTVFKQEFMSVKQRDWLGRILRKDGMPPPAAPLPQAVYVPPPMEQQTTDLFDIPF